MNHLRLTHWDYFLNNTVACIHIYIFSVMSCAYFQYGCIVWFTFFDFWSHSVWYLWVFTCLCSYEIPLCLETSHRTHVSNEGDSKVNVDFFFCQSCYLFVKIRRIKINIFYLYEYIICLQVVIPKLRWILHFAPELRAGDLLSELQNPKMQLMSFPLLFLLELILRLSIHTAG